MEEAAAVRRDPPSLVVVITPMRDMQFDAMKNSNMSLRRPGEESKMRSTLLLAERNECVGDAKVPDTKKKKNHKN